MKTYVTVLIITVLSFSPVANLHAQSETIKNAREAVVESIDRVNQGELEHAPEAQRFDVKRIALKNIFTLSKIEVQELSGKLTSLLLANENENTQALRTKFAAALDSYLAYLSTTQNILEDAGDLTEVEGVAGDLKDWREKIYDPETKKILDFTLAFQNRQALKIAEGRLLKINADVKRTKLNRQKNDVAQLLIVSAGSNLKNARALNEEAVTSVLAYLRPPLVTEQNVLDTAGTLSPQTDETMKSGTALGAPSDNALLQEKVPSTLHELVSDSVNEIRTAYEKLIRISELLKKAGK